MTVHKEQYTQYLNELDNLFTSTVFDHLADFKKELLSPDVTNIMELYYSGDQVLVFCEFRESTTIYETIDSETFIDWVLKVTGYYDEDEDDGGDVA